MAFKKWIDVPAPVKRHVIGGLKASVAGLGARMFAVPPGVPADITEQIQAIEAAIAELERVPVHVRSAPGVDVSACSERGSHLRFAMGQAGITCPTCKEKRSNKTKASAQQAKMVKVHAAMKAVRRAEVPADKRG